MDDRDLLENFRFCPHSAEGQKDNMFKRAQLNMYISRFIYANRRTQQQYTRNKFNRSPHCVYDIYVWFHSGQSLKLSKKQKRKQNWQKINTKTIRPIEIYGIEWF